MVETVSASTLPQGSTNSSAAQQLEPGTELKARVESNLPGGVVRLATKEGKVDLRVSAPLPTDAEVTVTVSGSKQQPTILIATDKGTAQPTSQQSGAPQGQAAAQPQSNASQQGGTQTVLPPQTAAAGPVHTAAPAGAHLVQVLTASANPASTASQPMQAVLSNGTPPLPGQTLQSSAPTPTPLPMQGQTGQGQIVQGQTGQGLGPQAAGTPSATAQVNGPQSIGGLAGQSQNTLPVGPGGSGAVHTAAGPAQVVQPLPGSPGASGQTSGTPAAPLTSSATTSAQTPASSSILPTPAGAGQPGAGQAGQGANVVPQGGGGTVASAAVSAPSGASGLPPAAPSTQASAQTAVQAGASNPQGTQSSGTAGQPPPSSASQPGGTVGQTPIAPPSGGQTGTTSPIPSAASTPGQMVAGQPQAFPGSPAGSGQAVSSPMSFQGAQAVPTPIAGQATATGTTSPGVSGAAPLITGTPSGAQPLAQGGGQSAPLASLTTGSNGLGQQPGAPPVRVLSGQAYQQLGSQPLGGSPAAKSGPPTATTASGPVAELGGALSRPLGEQQASLTSLFAQVGSLMTAQSAGNVSMPDAVVKAMQQILGLRLNLSSGPSAGDLQQAVRQSGQFREAQLALPGGGAGSAPDLKSVLLSFKSLLQQLGARPEITRPAGQPAAPSRHAGPQGQAPQVASGYWAGAAPQNLQALLKETDAALARLRLTQLSNAGLARDGAPQAMAKPMDLVLELPLALGQETAVMQMQIGRDGAGNQNGEEAEPAWRLRFALDLTATGPLEAAISLRGGGTYASLWVDRKDTFDNLNAVRETMEAAFADAGLDLQELRLIRGLPPKTAAYYGTKIDRQS